MGKTRCRARRRTWPRRRAAIRARRRRCRIAHTAAPFTPILPLTDDDSPQIMAAQHGAGMMHIAWRSGKGAMMTDVEYRSQRQPVAARGERGPQILHPARIGLEKRDTLSDRLWCAHVACHAHVLLMRGHAEKFFMTATPKEGPFPSICGK